MRDILDTLVERWRADETVAVATVVATYSSAPRSPGSAMLVTSEGDVHGSVSGGCIDGAVYECCMEAVKTGRGGLFEFGVSDESAFAVGLTCGGIITIFVETISRRRFPELEQVWADIHAATPVTVTTVVSHPDAALTARHLVALADGVIGSLGHEALDRAVEPIARRALGSTGSSLVRLGVDGDCVGDEVAVFIQSFAPSARLIVFGANDFASALIQQAGLLGYHTTLCDARPLFATVARYPAADDVVVDWPRRYLDHEIRAGRVDSRTALCVLTHDPKFDIPLLVCALRDCPAGFVGAMGSRRTHHQRMESLREVGVTPEELSRMSSPIGLDIGAATPGETAVSIVAEIISLNRGGTGARLGHTSGRIHTTKTADFVVDRVSAGQNGRHDDLQRL